MTETTTIPIEATASGEHVPIQAPTVSPPDVLPADVLMEVIVAFLAPMFLGAGLGHMGLARRAAQEAVNAYRGRSHADLIAIAQVIAFGLAALGSLRLAMADDLPLSVTLRLRSNANALNRSAEQNRRAIAAHGSGDAAPQRSETATDARCGVIAVRYGAAVSPETPANAQQRPKPIADRKPRLQDAASAAPSASAPVTAPMTAGQPGHERKCHEQPGLEQQDHKRQNQAIWAAAMTEAAGKFTAGLCHLPPAERAHATTRAGVLASSANALLSATTPPWLRPGAPGQIWPCPTPGPTRPIG